MNYCKYIASQLVTRVYVIGKDDAIRLKFRPLSATCNVQYLDAYDIDFKQQSELDGRYKFSYELNFSLDGYQPFNAEDYYFAVRTKSGESFLINKEFTSVSHAFTLNNNECFTRITVDVEENLPVFPITIGSESPYLDSEDCSYGGGGKTSLSLVNHERSALNASGDVVSYDAVFLDNIADNVSLTETFDGFVYSQTIQFQRPLDKDGVIGSYYLMEFQDNVWNAIITKGGLSYYVGWELGMHVNTVIESNNDESTLTIELRSDQNTGLLTNDGVVEVIDDELEWKYVLHTTDNNHYGWVCLNNAPNEDGEAMYIVQEAFYRNGESAHQYKINEDYQGWYDDLNIVGTFDTQMTFYKDSCYMPDTLKIEGITSPLKFNIVGQRRNIQINSKWSNWVATTVPSFVTLSQERGTSGSTTITMTCTGNTNEQGTLLIANAHNAQSFTIIADFTAAVIVQSTEIDYKPKTLTYWLRRPVYLYRKSSTSGFDAAVAISGKWAKITYPENQTGQDVVYTFVFKETAYPHKEQTVVITQHPQS